MSQNLSIQRLFVALNLQFWIQEKENGSGTCASRLFRIKESHNSFPYDTLEKLIDGFIHKSHQNEILSSIHTYLNTRVHSEIELKLRKHNYEYHLLSCKSPRLLGDIILANTHCAWFFDFMDKNKCQIKYDNNNFFYQEAIEMIRTGGWFASFIHTKTYWNKRARILLENLKEFRSSIRFPLFYFTEAYSFKVRLEKGICFDILFNNG
ncbi:hypothetical protein [Ascidiimonas sp. W6]|uniref:hypothetical protein n=1 Tax=Ascidiimonas meishanensis TaxID=3128903 RepID=UPI0030EE5465